MKLHYDYSQNVSLDSVDNIIVYLNGQLSLWVKNENQLKEIEICITPSIQQSYKIAKSISHIMVVLTLLFENKIVLEDRIDHLQIIKTQIYELKKISKNEQVILDKILYFIDQSLQEKVCIEEYLQSIKEPLKNLAKEATHLQLMGMHAIVMDWMKRYTIKLENLYVLIAGSKGPREGLIEDQFFKKLYENKKITDMNDHILYIEMLPEQCSKMITEQLVNTFKKQMLNKIIGDSMLNDPNAMNKDILATHAAEVLDDINQCPIFKNL